MTNEEFIAQNLCNDCNDKGTCSVSCYWFDHMKRLAELKDEQFTKQKQSFIDNACEWLAKNYQNLDYINMKGDLFDLSMVEDFRKAMEETK